MYMLTTRLHQITEASRQAKSEGKTSFLDRGAVGDTLFAILNHRLGNMDNEAMHVYKSVCRQRLPASLSDHVDILLYLDASPSECYRRVTTVRKNDAENGIPLSYLEAVDHVYFELIVNWLGNNRNSPYHEMNIGVCPKAVFLRWDRFGNVEDVILALQQTQAGTRKLPTVKFVDAFLPSESELTTKTTMEEKKKDNAIMMISTQADVDRLFAELTNTDTIAGQQQTDSNAATPPVVVEWGKLEHSNAFRRVIFWLLSQGADLTMVDNNIPQASASTPHPHTRFKKKKNNNLISCRDARN